MIPDINYVDRPFHELKRLIKERKPEFDLKRIERAYEFAKEAHDGQFRMSGDPYVSHPTEVAAILTEFPVDEDTIISALLHDVPEDTHFTIKDIEKRFGKGVSHVVNALTKLSKVYYKHSMSERQIQSLRKMFLEIADDPRVVIVKLADRMHNMHTLRYLRPDKQQRIAKETLEIYAPLANLYGIYQLRWQLEDLCFMYLQPEEYSRIQSFMQGQAKEHEHFIRDSIKILKKNLKKQNIEAEMSGRSKHFYSIYRKMIRDKKTLREIYDYLAIRVIVKEKSEAYQALGVIHGVFTPKVNRFKDYISLPKANGYQSLHTTVIGLKGQLTEVQIRTEDMNYEAEFGSAAHSRYKNENNDLSKSITQLRSEKRPEAIIRTLQDDILQKKIFVFTPKGEVVNLPEGSTVLDYIYRLNLSIKKSFRAVVNGRSHSITGMLQSGDHIEIIYGNQKQDGPERWWLGHVKTTKARKAIRGFFKKRSFEQRVKLGEIELQKALDHENQGLVYQIQEDLMEQTAEHFQTESFAELLAQIGEGSLEVNTVYKQLYPELKVRFLDRIWRWAYKHYKRFRPTIDEFKYTIRVKVDAFDRVGLLQEALTPFHELNIPITKLRTNGHDVPNIRNIKTPYGIVKGNPDYKVQVKMDLLITKHENLITLFDRVEKIPGVIRIQRVFRTQQVTFSLFATAILLYVIAHPWVLIWVKANISGSTLLLHSSIYLIYLSVLILMLWLRSMGNKTFPHFEETKYFWPLTYGISLLTFITLVLDDYIFDLGLSFIVLALVFMLHLTLLLVSYRAHQKRRLRHLSHLNELGRKPHLDSLRD